MYYWVGFRKMKIEINRYEIDQIQYGLIQDYRNRYTQIDREIDRWTIDREIDMKLVYQKYLRKQIDVAA